MGRSRVSRLCEGLDGEVAELRGADLSSEEWPYLWLDATYVPCREAGAPRSVALVTAVACSGSARRRVVGIECIDTESYLSWRGFLLSLRSRGLSGVRLVGAVCCDQNDAWACERNFIDRRSLEPGYEREPLPEEPGGEERVLRLVEEAFDRKRRAA